MPFQRVWPIKPDVVLARVRNQLMARLAASWLRDQNAALREMHRVLKVGGRALILEFSRVRAAPLKDLYDAYSFGVLPRLGQLVVGDADSYRYLAESIRKHPDQDTLREMMCAAGFERCDYRNLAGGIVAIHSGYKV